MKKIYIELESIKKNKNAFSTQSTILMGSEIEFESNFLPNDFRDNENVSILTWGSDGGYTGLIIDPKLADKYLTSPQPGLTIIVKNNFQNFSHLPIPEYSYKYEEIICNNCGDGLIDYNYDDDETSFLKCQKCESVFLDSDFEYEEIKDALIRLENLKENNNEKI